MQNKLHAEQNIHAPNPGRSYLDIIGPNNIVNVVALIKNSKYMWDQVVQMQELGAQAIGNQEKKLQPLFTSGSGRKRTQGKSLWNKEGMQCFWNAERRRYEDTLQWVRDMVNHYGIRY
jgi:hypothetical protein